MKPDLTRPVDFTTYNGTDKVCTRDGMPWRSLGTINDKYFPNAGVVEIPNGRDVLGRWDNAGKYCATQTTSDLFYALPKKIEKTFWIAVFPDEIQDKYLKPSDLYDTKEEAMVIYTELCQIVPITLMVEE